MKMQKINFKLYIMSPVHIGCDESYEPSSFKIDKEKMKLIEFDRYKFYENLSLNEKKFFLNICQRADLRAIIDIINFIANIKIDNNFILKEADITSGILSNYQRIRELSQLDESQIKKQINKLEIKKTAFNPFDNKAYIPGSSIKGALRTGYLNLLAKESNKLPESNKLLESNSKELERKLLNYDSFESDPFRLIKVSDFMPFENIKTKIIYGINIKKDNYKSGRGIPVMFETISEESVFKGSITYQKDSKNIKKEIDILSCLKANHQFYYSLLEEENKILSKIGASTRILTNIKKAFANKLNEKAFCIRIGRHSGAEAVTIEDYRKITIIGKGRKSSSPLKPTTIWLASDDSKPSTNTHLIPFGWCVLEIV